MAMKPALSLAVAALMSFGVTAALSQTVTLNTVEYVGGVPDAARMGAYGPLQGCTNPSQLVFGTMPNGGPVSEVAVEQHILHPGDSVPLPRYSDGVEAQESDVFWTAHVWEARFPHWAYRELLPAATGSDGDRATVSFSGRMYSGGHMIINPYRFPIFETREVDVVVTVIATRRVLATKTLQPSWGSLKAQAP